jgi:hypothetical protein
MGRRIAQIQRGMKNLEPIVLIFSGINLVITRKP